MADKMPHENSNAPYAVRIDPTKEGLSQEQINYIRHIELEQLKKKMPQLRRRNMVMALSMGALILGIYGYTFYSVTQERIIDEIDEEAKRARMKAPKTGPN